MNKDNIKTIIVLSIIFLLIIGTVYYFSTKEKNNEEQTEFVELTELDDESLYFSVSEGINYLFTSINNNDNEIVINLLNNKFIEENNLTTSNVINHFEEYKNLSFKASTINVISNKEKYAFLIEGLIINDVFEQPTTIKGTKYFVLYYDIITSYYNILPITEKKYNNYKNNKNLKPTTISSNQNNVLTLKTYNNATLSTYYFNDILTNMYNNPEYIYDKIGQNTKENYFKNIDEFNEYLLENDTFINNALQKYNKNNKTYNLVDNKNNKYTINVRNGLNYTVEITINEQ